MKSPITSNTKGFLVGEAMIAFSLMTLLITSTVILSATMNELRASATRMLEHIPFAIENLASTTLTTKKVYGNDTITTSLDPFLLSTSDYVTAWGRDTCDPRLDLGSNPDTKTLSINLGSGNVGTDLEVRNGIGYLGADSSLASAHDFFIIDTASSSLISSLTTGPGLSALEIAGQYAYAANLGTTNQLQVIDIQNRSTPVIVSQFKLPLPEASTTPPFATAIFYTKGLAYLGTEKWGGSEFAVIDVTTPASPNYLGGFETNTLISSIYVRDGLAYVAASDIGQMRILDVKNPTAIYEVSQFSPSGWQTQAGKSLSYFEGNLSFGRTTGGFNQVNNHELFLFSSSTASIDIPGGVYGIIDRPPYISILTRSPGHEFQIWKRDLSEKVFEKTFSSQPAAMACDNSTLFFI